MKVKLLNRFLECCHAILSLWTLNINPDTPITSMRQLADKRPGDRGCWEPSKTQWIR